MDDDTKWLAEALDKILELRKEATAAAKVIETVKSWHSERFCPFCLQLDGTHTEGCIYAEWEKVREDAHTG